MESLRLMEVCAVGLPSFVLAVRAIPLLLPPLRSSARLPSRSSAYSFAPSCSKALLFPACTHKTPHDEVAVASPRRGVLLHLLLRFSASLPHGWPRWLADASSSC